MDEFTLAAYRQAVGFFYEERLAERGEGMERRPVGTGFFISVIGDDQKVRSIYLATARHVVQILKGSEGDTFVRVNKNTSGVEYLPIPEDRWREHPEPEVDLAVLPWSWPRVQNIAIAALPLENLTQRRASHIAGEREKPWPPNEGEQTVLMGLMLSYQGEERNLPIVRVGHVALNSDEPMDFEGGLSNYRIIESQAYKGNSGAPVWVRYTGEVLDVLAPVRADKREYKYKETFAFLGVLSKAFPSESEMDWREGVPKHYWNYGIGAVVPGEFLVEQINELEAEKDQEARDRHQG